MSRKPLKVLVVEDEVLIAFAVCLDLEDLGCTVLPPVHDGSTAVQIAALEQPDIILMDICLQGNVDGIEAARLITAHQSTPVCFMSGYTPAEFEGRKAELAGHDFLSKPVSKRQLKQLISDSLG